MVELLCRNGLLDRAAIAPRLSRLYETGELISGGWLAASRLGRGPADERAAILHYAKLGCALLEPYATARGRRELALILRGALDD